MTVKFRRKLYTRGSSYETTIPVQMLFNLDLDKKQDVIFEYDANKKRWFVSFEVRKKSSHSSPKVYNKEVNK